MMRRNAKRKSSILQMLEQKKKQGKNKTELEESKNRKETKEKDKRSEGRIVKT